MQKYICIHGHFYQPPRENAWLEDVELQDSAYPHHDWNERINSECYAPNTASRLLDADGKIIAIVNNYSQISFNFGPTLLSWLEKQKPKVYEKIIEADKISAERFSGHGSALSQVYNHMIMPLANDRDKYTQVLWGLKDFEFRFNRFPEGMWLPETAVDIATLEVLAKLGLKFAILAPHQAKRIKKMEKGARWYPVEGGKVDPSRPYLCRLPSGKTISIFFYDGPISQDIAFGGLLRNGEQFAKRLLSAFPEDGEPQRLIHIATDGETYGHHHRYGDMALAYCLYHIQEKDPATITIYGEYLEKFPPSYELEIVENTSWSCVHGVGRWKENCGCNSGMNPGWNQEWRKPLREALDWLREALVPMFEREADSFLKDPWGARNEYISVVLDRSIDNVERFFKDTAKKELNDEEKSKVLRLLEMQRNAMLMYTSCGWFFDEVSGIETTQVLQYAARAIQLAESIAGNSLEDEFLQRIEKAPSNIYEYGRKPYEMFVKPARVDLLRVGAHYAVSSLFEEYSDTAQIYCYTIKKESEEKKEAGKMKLGIGKIQIRSDLTWNLSTVKYAAVHLGDHNIYGGVKEFNGDSEFENLKNAIKKVFDKADVAELIHILEKNFGQHRYSLWHLFKDQQRKIIEKTRILRDPLTNVEALNRQIYENNYTLLGVLKDLRIPIPKSLLVSTEFIINVDIKKMFEEDEVDIGRLENLIQEWKKWEIELDKPTLGFVISSWIVQRMEKLAERPENIDFLQETESILKLVRTLPIDFDIWQAQNIYFFLGQNVCNVIDKKFQSSDEVQQWKTLFKKIGDHLYVKIEC